MSAAELPLARLTLTDYGDENRYNDDFLRAAFGQPSPKFKFRRNSESEYKDVVWQTRHRFSPDGDVTMFMLWYQNCQSEWLDERHSLVRVEIKRFAGLLMESFPQWLDECLTIQDEKLIRQAQRETPQQRVYSLFSAVTAETAREIDVSVNTVYSMLSANLPAYRDRIRDLFVEVCTSEAKSATATTHDQPTSSISQRTYSLRPREPSGEVEMSGM